MAGRVHELAGGFDAAEKRARDEAAGLLAPEPKGASPGPGGNGEVRRIAGDIDARHRAADEPSAVLRADRPAPRAHADAESSAGGLTRSASPETGAPTTLAETPVPPGDDGTGDGEASSPRKGGPAAQGPCCGCIAPEDEAVWVAGAGAAGVVVACFLLVPLLFPAGAAAVATIGTSGKTAAVFAGM
eukprot:TRINITY_DN16528_c0_g1_i1.p2 TRINITY_DN16528_c0_g1~~TRINITY_DN16528_c0_g1_i1.p2  ORF type:complete len:187 (+),score=32.21 TRINITY_DN16528_c0_g1_i1:80-640(+)